VTNQNCKRNSFSYYLPVFPAVEGKLVPLARILKVCNAASFVLLKVGNEWPAALCMQKCWACLQRVWRLRAHKYVYSLGYRKVNFMEAYCYFILVTVDCSFDCVYWVSFLEGGDRADSTSALPYPITEQGIHIQRSCRQWSTKQIKAATH
jgi:hypothetical protein